MLGYAWRTRGRCHLPKPVFPVGTRTGGPYKGGPWVSLYSSTLHVHRTTRQDIRGLVPSQDPTPKTEGTTLQSQDPGCREYSSDPE